MYTITSTYMKCIIFSFVIEDILKYNCMMCLPSSSGSILHHLLIVTISKTGEKKKKKKKQRQTKKTHTNWTKKEGGKYSWNRLEPCHTLLLPPLENASTVVGIERTHIYRYTMKIQYIILETIPTYAT